MGLRTNFTKTKIKEQLNRILVSPAFRSSKVLSGFLEFIINETLEGKEGEIKEYTIGLNVLSRNSNFNPQLDAIVRIHAGRLRRALKEYYHDTGKKDLIYIEIPKGSYIPVFESLTGNDIEPTDTKDTIKLERKKPVVAVLPFRNISKDASRDFFADGLGEQLSTELTHFHDLSTISYYSSRHAAEKTTDIKEAAALLGAKYLVTGSIQNDNINLRIGAQLILAGSGEQLWTKSFERNNTAADLFEIQNEIVRSILTAIGGYYGAIFRDVLKTPYAKLANSLETYDAVFWYYHFQKVWTVEVYLKTIAALEAAVKADPDYALAWAMLGELYLDDKAVEFKKIADPREEGLKCALRAVAIDPNCQHGYQALAWIYLFYHNHDESVNAANKCIAINPNSASVAVGMGFALTCAGEFERGFELMNDSIERNPYYPWWINAGYIFYFLYKKEYKQALRWAEKMNKPELLWESMSKACALGHLDRKEEAGKNLELLKQLLPDTANQVKEVIESFLLSSDLKNEILSGLEKAGLKI